MTTEEIVRDLIEMQVGVDAEKLSGTDNLVDDGGLDSLDMIELCMACEDRFKLDIPDDDWDGLRTIHQIVAYIDRMKTQ